MFLDSTTINISKSVYVDLFGKNNKIFESSIRILTFGILSL